MDYLKKAIIGIVIVPLCLMLVSSPVLADAGDDETQEMKKEITILKKRLSDLEARLEKAEVVKVGAPPAVPPAEVGEAVLRHHAVYAPPSEKIPALTWPVAGIYTVPGTKDLGALTGIAWLSGTKIRGWIDANYVYNFNQPDRSVVNANQSSSIVKGHDVSVEGRTFDVHHNSFNLSLAELEIEKVPEFGGVGYKFDIAFGETQDIIIDTIKGSVGAEAASDSVTALDKTFQHASVSYIAPIGKGLRIDFGKFVTHIGGETIATVKNWNYSHSFFYTYAIPFQDTGFHLNYPWFDNLYTDFYILNGWNVTIDNNSGKTYGPSFGWTPLPWLSLCTNYLVGPEQTDNSTNMRHLWDTQIFLGPFFDRLNFMFNYDLGFEKNAVSRFNEDALWTGVTGYARYKITDWFEPSLRIEYFKDRDGPMTGMKQELLGFTLTLNTILGLGKNKESAILLRPEIRYDISTEDFFTQNRDFRKRRDQWTMGVGATWFF